MSGHGAAAGLGDSVLDLLPEDAEGIKQSRSVVTWDKRKMAYVRHMGGDVLTRGEKRPLQVRVAFVVYTCPLSSAETWGDSTVETLRCCFFPVTPSARAICTHRRSAQGVVYPIGLGERRTPLAFGWEQEAQEHGNAWRGVCARRFYPVFPEAPDGWCRRLPTSEPSSASLNSKHGVVFCNEANRRVI